jgi:HEAT repeat protein/cyclophilin family peptidyl-prolyl cis-trans isomerase
MAIGAAACATAPSMPPRAASPQPAPIAAGPSIDQKTASMLRLEDRRVLGDAAVPAPPPLAGQPAAAAAPPPDLVRFLADADARVRRRAALAIGHVGLPQGVGPLVALLSDPDPDVRQTAAFALGLIGDRRARDPLVVSLADPSPLVQGSAAEALGLMGDSAAADPIGKLIDRIVQSGALAEPPADADAGRRDTPAGAFRLGVYALVRLKAYDQLASSVLDEAGQPRIRWWPVAFALQRLGDPHAFNALMTLAQDPEPYTRAFAVKGLGALKNRAAVPVLVAQMSTTDRGVLVETIRALARIGDPTGAPPVKKLAQATTTEPHIRLEAISALGSLPAPGVADALLDAVTDPNPAIRGAALRATAALDPEGFVAVLSGLDPDSNWSVRATLANVLGGLTPAAGLARLMPMLTDADQRVLPAVLESLAKLKAPNVEAILLEKLKADDPIVRAAAATALGQLKPAGVAEPLTAAYTAAQGDSSYAARAAVLAALANIGAAAAVPVLRTALADKDWAVRVRAAMLLKQLEPATAADVDQQMRPAPTLLAPEAYQAERLLKAAPIEAVIDTDRGAIRIELDPEAAPLTVESFVSLARKGFFDGLSVHRVVPNFVVQTGDPRGDGEGGPGYTIRDELNERPYLRGTVGMALDPWPDTGGSQFFITLSPQPHLDAKYTVFGRVIAGMEVVDAIEQADVIRRVRVLDGTQTGNR